MIELAANALRDVQGRSVQALSQTFILDSIAPTVGYSSIGAGDTVNLDLWGTLDYTVRFSEALLPLDDDAISLYSAYTEDTYWPASSTTTLTEDGKTEITFHFQDLPTGDYTLTLIASALRDLAGNGPGGRRYDHHVQRHRPEPHQPVRSAAPGEPGPTGPGQWRPSRRTSRKTSGQSPSLPATPSA